MALLGDPRDRLRVLLDVLPAQQEEGGGHLLALQQVEEFGGVLAGAAVEGQRDALGDRAVHLTLGELHPRPRLPVAARLVGPGPLVGGRHRLRRAGGERGEGGQRQGGDGGTADAVRAAAGAGLGVRQSVHAVYRWSG